MGLQTTRLAVGLSLIIFAKSLQAAPVAVTVLESASGAPITGATVARLIEPSGYSAHPVITTPPIIVGTTDADGVIHLDCDPAMRSAFFVSAAGKAPAVFGFWGCVPPTYRMLLSPATATYSGRIVDSNNQPLADAPLCICIYDFGLLESVRIFEAATFVFALSARTDSAGRFSTPAATTGDVINVAVQQKGSWHSAPMPAAYDGLDPTLRDGSFVGHLAADSVPVLSPPATQPTRQSLRLHLRVVDADTNLPIKAVRVSPGGAQPGQFTRTLFRSALELAGDDIRWNFYDSAWEYFLRVEADGYTAAPTRLVKSSEQQADLELRLHKTKPIELRVLTPTSQPAAGAVAYLATPTIHTIVRSGLARSDDPPPIAVADAQGILRFSPPGEPYRLAISHATGIVEVAPPTTQPIVIDAGATVHVTAGTAANPLANLGIEGQSGTNDLDCQINWSTRVRTDARGQALIPHCRAGYFSCAVFPPSDDLDWKYLEIQSQVATGQRLEMPLLDGAVTVHGLLQQPAGLAWSELSLQRVGPPAMLPADLNRQPKQQRDKVIIAALKHASTTQPDRPFYVGIKMRPRRDGSIEMPGLQPGTYQLTSWAQPVRTAATAAPTTLPAPLPLEWSFTIADGSSGRVDLGTISAVDADTLQLSIGQSVPELSATTLDGKSFSPKKLRGKYVLLDFWGTWCGFCIEEEPGLLDAYEGWARDGRVVMISASVDDTVEQVRKHVEEKKLPWTQLVLGPGNQTSVPKQFGVDGYPDIMLIGPDGKLIGDGLRGGGIRELLLKYLGQPSPPPTTQGTAALQ